MNRAENRTRHTHEAGHALLALKLGVPVTQVLGGFRSRTIHAEEHASAHDQLVIALAGGLVEEIVFGGRSPNCCLDDDQVVADVLRTLAADPALQQAERKRAEAATRQLLQHTGVLDAVTVIVGLLEDPPHEVAGTLLVPTIVREVPEMRSYLPLDTLRERWPALRRVTV